MAKLRDSLSFRGTRSNYVPEPGFIPNRGSLIEQRATNRLLPNFKYLIAPNASRELCSRYAIPVKSEGLKVWIAQQARYISGLGDLDKQILRSYSKYGDRLINGYIRGTLRDCKDLIEDMYQDLRSVPIISLLFIENMDHYRARIEIPSTEELMEDFTVEDSYEALMGEEMTEEEEKAEYDRQFQQA